MAKKCNLGTTSDIPNLFTPAGEREFKWKMIAGMLRGSGYSDCEIMKKYPQTKQYLTPKKAPVCSIKCTEDIAEQGLCNRYCHNKRCTK